MATGCFYAFELWEHECPFGGHINLLKPKPLNIFSSFPLRRLGRVSGSPQRSTRAFRRERDNHICRHLRSKQMQSSTTRPTLPQGEGDRTIEESQTVPDVVNTKDWYPEDVFIDDGCPNVD